MVLDHPEIPLHTNGSENDIRCQVTKRQVSGGTKTDTGRDCRDAFLGLGKTAGSSASRSGITSAPGSASPPLPPCRPSRTHSLPRPARLTGCQTRGFAPLTIIAPRL